MPEEISLKTKLLNTLYVSLTFAVLMWVTMVNFYLGNSEELSSTLAEVVIVGFAFSAFLFCGVAAVQLVFLKATRCFYWVNLVLLVLVLFLFIQSNLFVWPTDAAQFSLINAYTHPGPCMIEILFYAVAIGLLCWKKEIRQFLFSNEFKVAFILMGTLFLGFCTNIRSSEESFLKNDKWVPAENEIAYGNKHTELIPLTKFHVSEKSNVIIVVVDAYGEDYFEETLQDPDCQVREQFKDFQHFRRLVSQVPYTLRAVPTLLTGDRIFESKSSTTYCRLLGKAYGQGDCLLTRLSQNGYQNWVFDLINNNVYPHSPQLIVNSAYKETTGNYVFSHVLTNFIIPHCAYRMSPIIFKSKVFCCCNKLIWKCFIQKFINYIFSFNMHLSFIKSSSRNS